MNGKEPTAEDRLLALVTSYATLKAAYITLERELTDIRKRHAEEVAAAVRWTVKFVQGRPACSKSEMAHLTVAAYHAQAGREP
jgi:hypothetical protein